MTPNRVGMQQQKCRPPKTSSYRILRILFPIERAASCLVRFSAGPLGSVGSNFSDTPFSATNGGGEEAYTAEGGRRDLNGFLIAAQWLW